MKELDPHTIRPCLACGGTNVHLESMKVFLDGWRNRVKALAQYLADLEREEN